MSASSRSTPASPCVRSPLSGITASSSSSSSPRCTTLHYLGPPGTYSHHVARSLTSRLRVRICHHWDAENIVAAQECAEELQRRAVVLKPCSSISATVIEARSTAQSQLAAGRDDPQARALATSLALLPYENSSNGPVVDAHQIIQDETEWGLRIVGEMYLPVRHSLLVTRQTECALRGSKEQVEKADLTKLTRVSSHTQALGQCAKFLTQHMQPDVVRHATSSTGEAARYLAQQGDLSATPDDGLPLEACIASSVCTLPEVYNLVELFSDIQDSEGNTTRFLLCQVWAARGGGGDDAIDDEEEDEGEGEDAPPLRYTVINRPRAEGEFLIGEPYLRATLRADHQGRNQKFLTRLLRHLSGSDDNATVNVRKIDRKARGEKAWTGEDELGVGDEGDWRSIYVLEVDVKQRVARGDEASARKRRKTLRSLSDLDDAHTALEKELEETYLEKAWDNINESAVLLVGSVLLLSDEERSCEALFA